MSATHGSAKVPSPAAKADGLAGRGSGGQIPPSLKIADLNGLGAPTDLGGKGRRTGAASLSRYHWAYSRHYFVHGIVHKLLSKLREQIGFGVLKRGFNGHRSMSTVSRGLLT